MSVGGVYNYMEPLVWALIQDTVRERQDVCSCPKCMQDMAAYALNHIPPRYVSSSEGEWFVEQAKTCDFPDQTVLNAVSVAIKVIIKNPRHDRGLTKVGQQQLLDELEIKLRSEHS